MRNVKTLSKQPTLLLAWGSLVVSQRLLGLSRGQMISYGSDRLPSGIHNQGQNRDEVAYSTHLQLVQIHAVESVMQLHGVS